MRRHYLVTYDICNDLRLRRVHGIVRDFGQPIQYSVFLAILAPSQKAELHRRLSHVVHCEQDQVLLFDLGRAAGQHEVDPPTYEVIGRPLTINTERFVVI